jgi:hypothetical protein
MNVSKETLMSAMTATTTSPSFFDELSLQRWDDHRYYHQSRINQTLHLFSATCFLITYGLLPVYPVAAVFLGWVVAMWSRQIGHFFFEPKGYDEVNDKSFDHKEAIKVGYNLQRKVVLLVLWLAVPAALWASPSCFGLLKPYRDLHGYLSSVAGLWLALAAAGLTLRTLWLCLTRNLQTGTVWFVKILTDPFHDIKMYYRAPLYLLRGQLIDPMYHARAPHG